jgi:hypothetical protein
MERIDSNALNNNQEMIWYYQFLFKLVKTM